MFHASRSLVRSSASAGPLAACAALAMFAMVACDDAPTRTLEPLGAHAVVGGTSKVDVCHIGDDGPRILSVSTNALAGHLGHGDYVATLQVDRQATLGDGVHFRLIADAVDSARAVRAAHHELRTAACRITISVSAETYVGSVVDRDQTIDRFPLFIDVPDISLVGALDLPIDDHGRAAAPPTGAAATILRPDAPLAAADAVVLLVGNDGGSSADGAEVRGFVFESGHDVNGTTSGGLAVTSLRAQRLLVTGNAFAPAFSAAIDLRASDGVASRNFLYRPGPGCGICLAGPGSYVASDNRVLDGGTVGILTSPVMLLGAASVGAHTGPARIVDPFVMPSSVDLEARIANNDVRDYTHNPNGVAAGIRVMAHAQGSGAVPQHTVATLDGNHLEHNTFAMIFDAGFPPGAGVSDLTIVTRGNEFARSCEHDLLVSFTRHSTSLGTGSGQPYLSGSTYRLTLSDVPWSDAWYDHRDATSMLLVGGAVISHGAVLAFNPGRITC